MAIIINIEEVTIQHSIFYTFDVFLYMICVHKNLMPQNAFFLFSSSLNFLARQMYSREQIPWFYHIR